ncbi:beta-L-arabinofuranosidase domain-containing protein [Demequina sp.]|uniref:beta-L-arabinofuranosidase domain-containing protein n=1 Tax=Demequina sp. TaxID=2050685 RepID=UPI0025CC898C|nr:beta-L-arabinofuranosidase domain-containing protein [Demequina sp.]
MSTIQLSGWMEQGARAALAGYIGQMPSLCVEVGGETFASGRVGAGSAARNAENVTWWNGESEGNWLSAWLGHVALVGSESDRDQAVERLERILAHQSEDGYLGMFSDATRAESDFITGDLWTQTCLLRALRLWADAAHDDRIHGAVDRAVAQACARLARAIARGTAFDHVTGTGHDLMFVDVLYDAFLRDPDPSYAASAIALYRAFSDAVIEEPFADFQQHRLESEAPFSGHGAHVAEHARVPLQIAAMTGDPDGTWMALFERGVTKMHGAIGSSGGLKSDETLGAPGHAPVHLPEAGEEHCALTELVDTWLTAAAVTLDTAWVDRAEAIILNAAPAGVFADGTAVAYLHAENQVAATRAMGTRWDYSPTHDDAAVCCAPNAGRLLPLALRHAVAPTPHGYRVQLYGPLSVSFQGVGGDVTIRQRTEYPFEEAIDIDVVAPGRRFTLELRVPGWCASPSVTTTDVTDATVERRGSRMVIDGIWHPTSSVRLVLPQAVACTPTADGRYALHLGPLVLAAPIAHISTATRRYPGSDLCDLDVFAADAAASWAPVIREDRLGEVTVERSRAGRADWTDSGIAVTLPMIDPSPRATATTGAEDTPITLVPIGQTTLRRTVFTMVRSR